MCDRGMRGASASHTLGQRCAGCRILSTRSVHGYDVRITRPAPWTILVVTVAACFDDPLGPGMMTVSLAGGNPDSVWTGAPADAVPPIRIKIKDAEGHAVRGATILWDTFGKQSRLANASAQSNSAGEASAVWLLGTDAAEEQRLQVTVHAARQEAQLVLRARAVPNVVSGLRVTGDTAPVLRVGDTLAVQVEAI